MRRVAPWLAASLLFGCESAASTLIVQVRTDLVPEITFSAIQTELLSAEGAIDAEVEVGATDDRRWAEGVRVAELVDLSPGVRALRVRAVDGDGATLVERPIRVELLGGVRVVTVLLTRDCVGVACPGAGDDPTATSCLAGRCVPGGCHEEDVASCGAPSCSVASDCGAEPSSCAAAACGAEGGCYVRLDHESCESGICTRAGCVPPPLGALFFAGLGTPCEDSVGACVDLCIDEPDPFECADACFPCNSECTQCGYQRLAECVRGLGECVVELDALLACAGASPVDVVPGCRASTCSTSFDAWESCAYASAMVRDTCWNAPRFCAAP